MSSASFSAILSSWGLLGMIDTQGKTCRFVESRSKTELGSVFALNDMFEDKWAESLTYSKLESLDFVSEMALTTFDILSEHFGKPSSA
jgi:hypothetical protein